jgi:phosphotriesterase-related protein
MPIHTVLGPIEPAQLGATNMHEHLLIDGRAWLDSPREDYPVDQKVTLENLGFVRWNLLSLEDNLIMDDPELALQEILPVKASGGSGIVDLTVIGLGRRPRDLQEIARRSGLHIMTGCGLYIHASHPDWVEQCSIGDLTELMVRELAEGIDDTGVIPALIGEIGTSDPVTEREWRVVTAAGRAGARTGAAVNIHLDPRGDHALAILDALTTEGMTPDRVIFSHMDQHLDRDYHLRVAHAGAVLEYDTFGSEFYFGSLFKDPTDEERMQYVRMLVDEGFEQQLVLSSDVWVKAQLRAYGGMGFDHVMRRIVPALRDVYGISSAALDTMLIDTPRRLLGRPELDGPQARISASEASTSGAAR